MLKTKQIALALCMVLLIVLIAGCNSGRTEPIPLTESPLVSEKEPVARIPLTAEEESILEIMGDDVNRISEEDYSHAIFELQAHPDSFSGQVYQLEGIYSSAFNMNGQETPFVYRALVHNGEESVCGLPLKYMEKEIPDNTWIRVTAIIGTETFGDGEGTVLEVVAVETMDSVGQSPLEWDGVGHHH